MDENKWGCLLPAEGTVQITRPMLDLRKPKAFIPDEHFKLTLEEPPKLDKESVCTLTQNNVKLASYIHQMECISSDLNSNSNLPAYPTLATVLKDEPTVKNSSTSSSSGSANFSNGVNYKDVDTNLRQAVALITASYGFNSSSMSTLQTLTDVTHQYLSMLSKTVRANLDSEALTGKTGFFDCMDQVLHDMGIGNIYDLNEFYKKNVCGYHKNLTKKSEKLKAHSEAVLEKSRSSAKIKQERPVLSNWIPIANTNDTIASTSRWKPFVKNESSTQLHQHTSISLAKSNAKPQEHSGYSPPSGNAWQHSKRFYS